MPSIRNTRVTPKSTVGNTYSVMNTVLSSSPPTSQPSRRKNEDYVPRPMNAFMLYRSYVYNTGLVSNRYQNNLSEIVGAMWRAMSEVEKETWRKRADEVREEHRLRYPRYTHNSSKASGGDNATAARRPTGVGKVTIHSNTPTICVSTTHTEEVHPKTTPIIVPIRNFVEMTVPHPQFDNCEMPFDENSVLIAHPDIDVLDPNEILYDRIEQRSIEVFSSMHGYSSWTGDMAVDEEMKKEEVEELMKEFLVDL